MIDRSQIRATVVMPIQPFQFVVMHRVAKAAPMADPNDPARSVCPKHESEIHPETQSVDRLERHYMHSVIGDTF